MNLADAIQPAEGLAAPLVRLTANTILRFAMATVLFGAAMHYLVSGRKEASMGKMFTGALLVLASLLFL